MGHPPRRNPAPPRSAPGPATSAWPCPTAADSDPTSDKPGATRTASPEAETIEHTHTHKRFARYSSSASKSPRPQLKIRLRTDCPEKNRRAAKPAGSPSNGPTATSPPPRPGLSPNILPCNVSHLATRSSPQTSTGHPPRRNPAPPRSARGPATSAWPCPTAADSDPTSDKPGATRTASSPEAETIEHLQRFPGTVRTPRNHPRPQLKIRLRADCPEKIEEPVISDPRGSSRRRVSPKDWELANRSQA